MEPRGCLRGLRQLHKKRQKFTNITGLSAIACNFTAASFQIVAVLA